MSDHYLWEKTSLTCCWDTIASGFTIILGWFFTTWSFSFLAQPDSCESALLNDVLTNDDNASTVNINVTWSASDCAINYHYKLNPPFAYEPEGTTNMTFVSITGVLADGTLYNVTITPIDFLGTRGPTCQTPSFPCKN